MAKKRHYKRDSKSRDPDIPIINTIDTVKYVDKIMIRKQQVSSKEMIGLRQRRKKKLKRDSNSEPEIKFNFRTLNRTA